MALRLTILGLLACLVAGCDHHAVRRGVKPMHLRLLTERGPVHVFRPQGFQRATAVTVIYVHGYYVDVNEAFEQHALITQFQESNVNALFICPEAPEGDTEAVEWPNLTELLGTVADADVELPAGPVVAIAHSGGFRTVVPWLGSSLLESVFLLDGLYGNEGDFAAWLTGVGSGRHRLVLVGALTTPRIERFLAGFDDRVERDEIPLHPQAGERESSRLIFYHSQFDHMGLVTGGAAIPALLRLSPLPRLKEQG